MRLAIKFGYDGTAFHGSQRQKNSITVEGKILKFLVENNLIASEHKFQCASRTDAGVSALGNVIAFNTTERAEKILGMLNTMSDAMWFYGFAEVNAKFNPRRARERWYRYFLPVHKCGNEDALKKILGMFTGRHDFANFTRNKGVNTVREIYRIDVSRMEDFYVLDFYGNSFLWGMIRKIVGAAEYVMAGKYSANTIADALAQKTRIDFPMAEPQYLILMDVRYDFEFMVSNTIKRQLQRKIERTFGNLVVKNEIERGLKHRLSCTSSTEGNCNPCKQ